jgi:hypothetical protein
MVSIGPGAMAVKPFVWVFCPSFGFLEWAGEDPLAKSSISPFVGIVF